MHVRTEHWPAWMLAIVIACGTTAARGQELVAPSTPYYTNYEAADDANLAARVAELENALKKMDAKAKAAKAKAAKKPSVTVGGRIHWDTATFSQDAESLSQAGDMINGNEFRRVRLFAKGNISEVIDYIVQLDFAPLSAAASAVGFRDVYMTIKELPYAGNIRFGQFFECYGLENQTSSNYITFMERSVIGPAGGIGGRKPGIMLFNCNDAETVTWWIGGFAWEAPGQQFSDFPGSNASFDDNGGYALDARATYLPWYDEATEGRGLLHMGIGCTHRSVATVTSGTRYQVRQRPDSHLANYVVATGNIADAERINALNPELAFVYGPFSIQSEYEWAFVETTASGTAPFDGGYIYVSYFLTGENRGYNRRKAVFGRVKPYENFFRVRDEDGYIHTGKGAWELAYRVDYLNLNQLVDGAGRVVDQTLGINWYLSPYARLMLNYVHSETTDRVVQGALPGRAVADIIETRVQVDF